MTMICAYYMKILPYMNEKLFLNIAHMPLVGISQLSFKKVSQLGGRGLPKGHKMNLSGHKLRNRKIEKQKQYISATK